MKDRGFRIAHGCTRMVFLVGRWAVKVPQVRYGWRNFLFGLLANDQERTFARTRWHELCPVSFSLPLGLLVVMPRLQEVSQQVVDNGHVRAAMGYAESRGRGIPAEDKADSWGWLDGRIVAIDYGGFGR